MIRGRRDVLGGDAVLRSGRRRRQQGNEHEREQGQAEGEGSCHGADLLDDLPGRPDFPRRGPAAVTEDLSSAWPAARRELLGTLRRRGVSAEEANDIVQDVAERALRSRVAFDGHDSLMRWCHVVARNLTIDNSRRRRHLSSVDVPDVQEAIGVEDWVDARLTAATVREAAAQLSAADRVALFGENAGAATVAERVRRHRARARLAAMIAGVGAVLGWLGRSMRKLARLNQEVALALGPTIALAVLVVPHGSSHDSQARERHVPGQWPQLEASIDVDARAKPDHLNAFVTSSHPVVEPSDRPPRRPRSDALWRPHERVVIDPPVSEPTSIRTHDVEGNPATYCVWDAPVLGDWCTPI